MDNQLQIGTGVRAAVRDATAEAHERMHGLEPFKRIEAGALRRDAYAELLSGLWRFHAQIGASARAHGLERFSTASSRLELLHSDLTALARTPPEPRRTFDYPTEEHALGSLYVAEGSMFGGRVISRQLDYLFGRQAEGRRFFSGTADFAPRWRSLVQAMEKYAADANAVSDMVQGAERAFGLFELCLEEPSSRSIRDRSGHGCGPLRASC